MPKTCHHGNPTIVLPRVDHGTRSVVLWDDTRTIIWQSHQIPWSSETEYVRVNAWQGNFVGPARDWAILAPGTYSAHWFGQSAPDHEPLMTLNIESQVLFEQVFGDTVIGEPWESHGTWQKSTCGITPVKEDAWLFREAAMHGELMAQFEVDRSSALPNKHGLVARHYNASTHLRVEWVGSETDEFIRLIQQYSDGSDKDAAGVLAEARVQTNSNRIEISWQFNGSHHQVRLNGLDVLTITNGFMGGVDVVGLFASPGTTLKKTRMVTTQHVPRLEIEHESYRASVQPGNVRRLSFGPSGLSDQNLFWESGIQFGHIGGSEIKFTQGASLVATAQGPVATRIQWDGPMPKFVEQSHDVRGHACGMATFFPDHIVIRDEVLAWVRRSTGPDIDVLSRLLSSPARIATGEDRHFTPISMPADGVMTSLAPPDGSAFPVAMLQPFDLSGRTCWLQTMIHLRVPDSTVTPAAFFGWHCPHGLTGSYDFRAAPTVPGQTYLFEIVVSWFFDGDAALAEDDLLNRRDDWLSPMQAVMTHGRAVMYDTTVEQPREAVSFCGAFDRSMGMYTFEAEDEHCEFTLVPTHSDRLTRRGIGIAVRGLSANRLATWKCNDREIQTPGDGQVQRLPNGDAWLWLSSPADQIKLSVTTSPDT